MAKTILSEDEKKQVVGLLKKTDMSVKQVAEVLSVPMECVRSLKAHVTMGTYDTDDEGIIEEIENAQAATLSIERDLQTFLFNSLDQIEPGLKLYENGREFITDIGRIDILAIDGNENLVVIELKAGKAKDNALGQLLGYIGYVSSEIANDRKVRGYIIASEFDERLKYAVRGLPNVSLKSYKVRFTFEDVEKTGFPGSRSPMH